MSTDPDPDRRTDLRTHDGHETWDGAYDLCAPPTYIEPADECDLCGRESALEAIVIVGGDEIEIRTACPDHRDDVMGVA